VTPPPVCKVEVESVFSVTGFLTFTVVAATAISNIISNGITIIQFVHFLNHFFIAYLKFQLIITTTIITITTTMGM